MTELAKWAWLILLIILFAGPWTAVILLGDLLLLLVVYLAKPEWFKKVF